MKKKLKESSLSLFRTALIWAACLLFLSCSLKYDETVNVEERVPEFVFQDTSMVRCDNNKISFEMKAGVLEQYKKSSETFAKDISFISYDDDGSVSTEGQCGLLFSDTDKKFYELYDDIKLYNRSENTNFFAQILRWNEKNEQLTSGRGEMVKVEKDGTVMRGTGFSASGVSKSFSFRGTVSGEIETKSDLKKEGEGEEE
ncbi:MAG: LPS export ABC transporter periplasmic protein LptC [Treponema sp.]|nr:LPS export ABC transporter periplasmic protein LptC [Treponema sp.]